MKRLENFHYSSSQKITENVYSSEGRKSRERRAYGFKKQDPTQKRGEGNSTDDSVGEEASRPTAVGLG